MTAKDYVNFWDVYVKKWYDDMSKVHSKSLICWDNFYQEHPFDISSLFYYRFFPEPYFGNPHSEKLEAVFINLNPGTGGFEQEMFPKKSALLDLFGQKEHGSLYSKTMEKLIAESLNTKPELLPGTLKWWKNNRVKWVNTIFNKTVTLDNILGIELTPWHTTSFNELRRTLKSSEVKDYVLKPAAVISKLITNKYLNNGKYSIVIGRGLMGVEAVKKNVIFQPCVSRLLKGEQLKWNISRGMLDETTILIDFSRRKGGFGMGLPQSDKLKDFFRSELRS